MDNSNAKAPMQNSSQQDGRETSANPGPSGSNNQEAFVNEGGDFKSFLI